MKTDREQLADHDVERPSTCAGAALTSSDADGAAEAAPAPPVGVEPGLREGEERVYGPYLTQEVIGEGGMGVVFKAHHRETGQQVALKTIKRIWEPLLRHIRREIKALASLDHPGVVSILDSGERFGVPWYAMTLLHGEPLSSWRHSSQTSSLALVEQETVSAPATSLRSRAWGTSAARREALRVLQGEARSRLLTLTRRLCEPLAYLHEQGLVHRDLKPDNVMLLEGDRPVIFDFGLVSRFNLNTSRELAGTWRAVGTFRYMSPQQRAGERVNASADIYALGAVLFELLTGSPWEHADWPPAGWPLPQRDGLSALLASMLHRSPARRPTSRQVMAALDGFIHQGAGALTWAPTPSATLTRPPLVGRRQLYQAMERFIQGQLQAGRGGVTLILGSSGMGKTRLMAELTRRPRLMNAHVVSGQCHRLMSPGSDAQEHFGSPLRPLKPLLQLIGDRCRERGERWWRAVGLHRWGRLLALYEPSLGSLGWGDECLDPEHLSAEQAREVLFEILGDVMVDLAQKAPLVMMLDDLQWADDLTLGFLAFVGERRRFEQAAVVILGACREEEVQRLQEVIDVATVRKLSLTPLGRDDVCRMVVESLDTLTPPPGLNETLVQRAAGNPFYILEYLQAAIAEARLTLDAQGQWRWSGGLTLPESLRVLIERRAARLSESARSLARMLALLGQGVEEPLLLRALTMLEPGRRRLAGLGELIDEGIVESAAGGLRFLHDELRDVLIEGIDDAALATWRRCAALALEAHHDEDLSPHAAAIALHWHAVGEQTRAVKFYLMAARAARAQHAPQPTRRFFLAALALTPAESSSSVEIHGELAVVGYASWGRIEDALRHHQLAIDGARLLGDERLIAESLLQSTKTLYMAGDVVNAEVRACEALRLFEERADQGGVQRAAVSYNLFRGLLGERQEAIEAMRAVASTLDEGRQTKLLATAHSHLGLFLREAHAFDEAQEHTAKALALFVRLQHLHAVAFTRSHLGALCYLRGDLAGAMSSFLDALKVARQTREARTVAYMLNDLAECALECRDFEVARAYGVEALELARSSSAKVILTLITANLGLVDLMTGALSDGVEKLRSALDEVRVVGEVGVTCRIIIYAARGERLLGRRSAAEALLCEAAASAQSLGASFSRVMALCERGHLRLSQGVSAAPQVEAARGFVCEVSGLLPGAPVSRMVERLQVAQRVFEQGAPLLAGEAPDELPAPLREALLAPR